MQNELPIKSKKPVLITPEMAAEMLENNNNNRPLKQSKIDKYVQDMKAGNWKLTHQGIAFDKKNTLIDGQHRLSAIIKSGVSVHSFVGYGFERDVFDVIDTGGTRSKSDVLAISGQPPRIARIIAATVPYCITYEDGYVPNKTLPCKYGSPNLTTIEYFGFNPGIADSAVFITKMPRRDAILRESIACFIHYQISKKHNDADDFVAQILTGDGVTSRTVVFEMRKMLLADKIGNHRLIDTVIINRLITTYNYFHKSSNLSDPYQAISKVNSDAKVRLI